jgi:hypothetical protein
MTGGDGQDDESRMQVHSRPGRGHLDVVIDQSPSAVMDRLSEFLDQQRRFTATETTDRSARLTARPNWATWGGRIEVELEPLDSDRTLLRARWRPALPTTIGTWGQDDRDLRAIATALSDRRTT